jgi:4-hydroxymandelate oxidase
MASRAEEAGYTALCITVDAKIEPKRERNIRNNYVSAPSPNYPQIDSWTFSPDAPGGPTDIRDPAATWADLDSLAANTRLPLVVKGVMFGGGRNTLGGPRRQSGDRVQPRRRYLDTTFTTIEVLPEVVEAVDGNIEVYLDGGIRRGTDIVKALALGARAVLIGRPLFWGLSVNGEAGLTAVLEILRDELDTAMGMLGRTTIDSIDREVLGTISPLLSLFPQPADYRT